MYRRADLSRTITLVVALFLTAASTSAFAREFRAADTQNEEYPTVQALLYMGSLVAERTGGRHQIKVFHSRQLGEEKETLEQTRAGAIDLNRTNVALIGTMVPAMNVLAMPFLFRSVEHLQKVLDGPIGDEILGSFEPYGFVGLAFYDSGARSIYNSVRPVASMADLKGLRHSGAAIRADVRDDPGARRGAGRTALRAGADRARHQADRWRREQLAVLRHHGSLQACGLLHPDRTHDEPGSAGHVAKAWSGLSAEDQKIFREAARVRAASCARNGAISRSARASRRKTPASGLLPTIDRKPFEAAMAGIHAKAQQDPAMAQLIERIRKVE